MLKIRRRNDTCEQVDQFLGNRITFASNKTALSRLKDDHTSIIEASCGRDWENRVFLCRRALAFNERRRLIDSDEDMAMAAIRIIAYFRLLTLI